MALMITANAAKEIKRVMQEQKYTEDTPLRVGVRGGGCSGIQYALGFDTDAEYDESKDTKYDQHGLNVVIDKKSGMFLDVVTLDFFDGDEQRGFVFDNPDAARGGGCSGCGGH